MILNKHLCAGIVLFFLTPLVMSSCSGNGEMKATEETNTVTATIAPPKEPDIIVESNETTPSNGYIYEINAISIDASFDDFLDVWVAMLDEEDPRTSTLTNENSIVYYSDYNVFLEEAMIEDGEGIISYTPKEYEYHINKSFFIDDRGFYIYEFETEDWAINAFRSDLNDVLDMEDSISLYNYASDGYFFVRYDELNYYQLEYYVDNCIIIYHFSLYNGTEEQLSTFLDVCRLTGLPPSDELTAEIMQSN